MRKISRSSIIIFLALIGLPLLASAQNAPASSSTNYWYNPVVLSLVSLMLILLFAIGVMGNVLKSLVIMFREKEKRDKEKNKNIIKSVLLFAVISLSSIRSYAAEADTTIQNNTAPKNIAGISPNDFYTLVSMVVFEIAILICMLYIMRVLLRAIRNAPVVTKEVKIKARSAFWDRFNNAVAVEKEQDVLLDHDYDGIKELDNPLPPWWKYGFYVTIVFAFIYIYRYQVSKTGLNPTQEYEAEVLQAQAEQAAYLANAANNVDENSVTALTDVTNLNAGKSIFESTCAACHLKDGGGSVGPNLTDDYWLHGGGIKDIFKSIKYGWQEKGMKSWKDDFSPKKIQQLASYVRSLHGTHPATPKDKQGELYIEAGTAQPDTAKRKPDTTKVTQ